MPSFDELQQRLNPNLILKEQVQQLEEFVHHPVVSYFSAFCIPGKGFTAEAISIIASDMQGLQACLKDVKGEELTLILHTPGGELESTKQLISYLRSVFKKINVAVPHLAYSGGTMIACASDQIYMGPYSFLGPTDPQVPIENQMVPVGAILDEFQMAVKDIKEDPAKAQIWLRKLDKIPFGRLHAIMNLNEQSKKDTAKLLLEYHFHQNQECKEKADTIAEFLHGYKEHTSHGKGIGYREAQNIGLNIIDLGADANKELEDKILSIYHASTLLCLQSVISKIIINGNGKQFTIQQQPGVISR